MNDQEKANVQEQIKVLKVEVYDLSGYLNQVQNLVAEKNQQIFKLTQSLTENAPVAEQADKEEKQEK